MENWTIRHRIFTKESYITDYLVIRVQRSFAQGFSVLFNGIGTEKFKFYCKIERCTYKSSILLRSITTIIFLNRQLSKVHTVELNCYRAFVRKRILNYFCLIKRRPLLWNQKGLQITPSPPTTAQHTLWVTICRGRAGPGAPTKMLLHYETRGTSTRT